MSLPIPNMITISLTSNCDRSHHTSLLFLVVVFVFLVFFRHLFVEGFRTQPVGQGFILQ
ncbi:unnamed protein product [Laminaria digitata]